jgi:hypothetical protein
MRKHIVLALAVSLSATAGLPAVPDRPPKRNPVK